MSINLCVRVSSNVDFVPRRAATKACTLSSVWSANALKSSSLFANANVSLPVVRLVFIGGLTPNPFNNSANLGLDMRSFLSSIPASANSFSLRAFTSCK